MLIICPIKKYSEWENYPKEKALVDHQSVDNHLSILQFYDAFLENK
jgi:hypothetical protein